MYAPLQISLRGIPPSDTLQRSIRDKAQKLEHFYDRISACQVALTLGARHKRERGQFSVQVGVKVPGGKIEVTRGHDRSIHVALRDAFNAALRQLEAYARDERAPV